MKIPTFIPGTVVESKAAEARDPASRRIYEDAARQYDVEMKNAQELAKKLAAQSQWNSTFEYLSPESQLYLKRSAEPL